MAVRYRHFVKKCKVPRALRDDGCRTPARGEQPAAACSPPTPPRVLKNMGLGELGWCWRSLVFPAARNILQVTAEPPVVVNLGQQHVAEAPENCPLLPEWVSQHVFW